MIPQLALIDDVMKARNKEELMQIPIRIIEKEDGTGEIEYEPNRVMRFELCLVMLTALDKVKCHQKWYN